MNNSTSINKDYYTIVPEWILLSSSLVYSSFVYARDNHGAINQRRKYTNEPYIVHPIEVADMVRRYSESDEHMVCAALCHDLIEDTTVTMHDITNNLGTEIASLVDELTDISKKATIVGNREFRKMCDRFYLKERSAKAQLIKCCDIMSNLNDTVSFDHDFAKVYIKEKILLHCEMDKIKTFLVYQHTFEIIRYSLMVLFPEIKKRNGFIEEIQEQNDINLTNYIVY